MTRDEQTPEPLPESLLAKLKKADAVGPVITAKVDRTISGLTEDQFSSRTARRRKTAPAWFAVAATVLLAVILLPSRIDSPSSNALIYADVDQSGQIDIADVLALARSNKVSQDKLNAFAMQIVSLDDAEDAS